ncbi:uncharacterized protein LOC127789211 isoform X2 [Diospyros lotus]|uniref:uncharacterized protein LOC127789211 isoform X2 n=1 Tax=Diospyros lotus TaxID=55363 RepID=UPI0022567FA6|nr:uncharacterized protein LOC127789211 isoform X2 [Diospyros lotus]
MGSLLGFRRPQFSEEVAWLPAWLQQSNVEPLDNRFTEGEIVDQRSMVNTTVEEAVQSSRDEGRYKSCHLFLSEDDNSLACFTPSSGNVVHFHLHLSADHTLQHMSSPLSNSPQSGGIARNNVLLLQQTEALAGQEDVENQFRMDYNIGVMNLPTLSSQQQTSECHQSLAMDRDTRMEHGEITGCLEVSEINEAVELSIAASEALVILDTVKSSPSTESLETTAVLEVVLQVKQARLVGLKDSLNFSMQDIDEIDFLSDLDDSSMADAFEDVGLSVCHPNGLLACASAIPEVKDTPGLQNHYECEDKYKCEQDGYTKFDHDISGDQWTEYISNTAREIGKELPVEVLDFEKLKKLIDDPVSGLNTSIVASQSDSLMHGSVAVLVNSDVPATTEGVSLAAENVTSFQPETSPSCSREPWSYANERYAKLTTVGHDRFQSRWLGGWMWKKEITASGLIKPNNAKIISRYLVGETSYLSESAEVVPDGNSLVQKLEKGSLVASQSSIPFDRLHNRVDNGILLSQGIVGSSNLSLVDPLCSIVPCSISSENACYTSAQNPNDEIDAGKCSRPALEHYDMNLQGTSCLNAEFVHEEQQAASGSHFTVRRQLSSLRTHSILLPHSSAFAEMDDQHCNRPFPSKCSSELFSDEQNTSCKKVRTGLLSLKSMHKCSTDREMEESHQTSVMQNLVPDLMNQKIDYDKTAKSGTELQVQMKKNRYSPLVLNWARRFRFQASKDFTHDFGGEENPILDTEVPARKRVRFSETEIQLLQKKNLHKFPSSYRSCSTKRAGNRARSSNLKFKSKAQELKMDLGSHLEDGSKKGIKRLIFHAIEFLLTGFSRKKEKEIEGLVRKYGGAVLSDIPSPPNSRGKRSSRLKFQQLPIVLCSEKLETIKFLYGCAVNAYILKVNWVTDSVAAGSALPPNKYMIIPNHVGERDTRIRRALCLNNQNFIFDRVGIMFYGKPSFCTRLAKVVKHGGGQVFKTLQWLVQNHKAEKISIGVIVAEDESWALRHLKHCASEGRIPVMSASWIISSLHAGKLIPFSWGTMIPPLCCK